MCISNKLLIAILIKAVFSIEIEVNLLQQVADQTQKNINVLIANIQTNILLFSYCCELSLWVYAIDIVLKVALVYHYSAFGCYILRLGIDTSSFGTKDKQENKIKYYLFKCLVHNNRRKVIYQFITEFNYKLVIICTTFTVFNIFLINQSPIQ